MKHFFIGLFAFLVTVPSLANEGKSDSDDMEYRRELMVAGGISSPSLNPVAQNQNPAGLVYDQRLKVVASSVIDSGLVSGDGRILYGNGVVGGTFGIFYQSPNSGLSSTSTLEFGLAGEVKALDLAFGIDGTYVASAGNNTISPMGSADLGLLFNPHGPFRIGATLFQLVGGLQAMAAGISLDGEKDYTKAPASSTDTWPTFLQSGSSTFSFDVATDPHFSGCTLIPGLLTSARSLLQLSVGYGFSVGQNYVSWLGSGLMVGLDVAISDTFRAEISANERAGGAYLGITVRL